MRKTFAHKVCATSGKDLFATQQALGHASSGSTAAYLSLRQVELDAIILAL
jgi:site-specific recombinase XerC